MSKEELKKKARQVFALLKKLHPGAKIELRYSNPLELTVATILSAQCTDVKVNEVTARLFQKYKTPADYLAVPVEELEQDIRQTGFYRNKAKSLRGLTEQLLANHGGMVPGDMETLTRLPGIGRKTANVILGNAFDVPGIAVDTHVSRLSQRIGLTAETDPVKIEYALNELIAPKDWTLFSHTMIFHGRYTCNARKPKCEQCNITAHCDFFQNSKRAK
ncbi:MAG TPA: endonuclease III [bacterium]|nr:endonuclease III [bacterium]